MSARTCGRCGAPIPFADGAAVTCPYCGSENAPAPSEVVVAVPVQIIHNVVRVEGGAAREVRCPRCRKRLAGVLVEAVELDGCPGCGGIWIDNASANAILAAPKPIFAELARRAAANATAPGAGAERPTCACCPALLDRVEVRGVVLDVCGEHGTWFDAYELATLTETLGAPARAPRAARPTEVTCVGCGVTLAAERATIGERGPVCDGCWRRRQAELVAEGDKDAYARGGGEIARSGAIEGASIATLLVEGILEGVFDAVTS